MSKTVFLDAGHGGSDSGAVGVGGILEKNINLQVVLKIKKLLEVCGISVKTARKDDTFYTLESRCNYANNYKVDIFVSIHCNSFNKTVKGIESYSLNQNTSDLAHTIHNELIIDKLFTLNRGVKYNSFYVLKNTNMRATLIELGFIDNIEDIKILTDKQDELAKAITRGICKYLNVEYKEATQEPIHGTFYRVIAGSYNNKLTAQKQVDNLKSKGIDCFIDIYQK